MKILETPSGSSNAIYLAQRSQRRQLAGAGGDIRSPGRPRDPRPLLPLPPSVAAVFEPSVPPQRPLGALGTVQSQGSGERSEGRGGQGEGQEQRTLDEASDALTNLHERRSYEDGRSLDSVLLPQLLLVLPCPHRHHPAGHLVPGERGPASRKPPGSPRAPPTLRR